MKVWFWLKVKFYHWPFLNERGFFYQIKAVLKFLLKDLKKPRIIVYIREVLKDQNFIEIRHKLLT